MTVAPISIFFDGTLDPTLEYDKGLAVNANIKHRFTAASLPAGSVAAWSSDLGTALTLTQGSAAAMPSRQVVGLQPCVVFDGTADSMSVAYTPAATLTVYVVFRANTVPPAATQVVFTFGGTFFGIASSGKAAVIGSAGSVQSVNLLTAGTVYVAAFTLNAGAVTMDVNGEARSGTITQGTLDKIQIGASATTAFFGGGVYEVRIFESVHTTAQKNAEMNFLRNWWSAT